MCIRDREKYDESRRLLKDAMAILGNPEATAEDKDNAGKMHADSKVLMAEGEQLQEITGLSKKLADFAMTAPIVDQADPARPQGFKSFGDLLLSIHNTTFSPYADQRLKIWHGDKGEQSTAGMAMTGWASKS